MSLITEMPTSRTNALLTLQALLKGEEPPVFSDNAVARAIARAESPDASPVADDEAADAVSFASELLFPKETVQERIEGQRKYIPRKYQVVGIDRLKDLGRALLWDQPGMGKTLQASEAAADRLPCLVSAPNYLTEQWFNFLCEQYPEHKICIIDGSRAEREKHLALRYDWYIVNHEMFRSYTMPKWINTLVVDEAHHIRNRTAKQSKAIKDFARDIPQVFLLTATPLYKDPPDVWNLLSTLYPAEYTSFHDFVDKHCKYYNTRFGVKVLGVKNNERLYKELHDHGIGRTYKEVELELPQLITRNIVVQPTPEFMAKYNKVRFSYTYNDKDIQSLMEAMHRLRRITLEQKFGPALELLMDDAEGAIFTWYKDTAQILAEQLKVPCIHGDVPASDRGKIVKENKLFVGTMAAMSEGVDASHVNHAIFFESDYVPARMYQALSRVRRHRASAAPVRCTYIYCKGTIDEIVHNAAQGRNATIKSVMKQALLGDD